MKRLILLTESQTILKTVFQVVRTILQNKDKQEPVPIHFPVV